jgi:hypothetical protein
MGVFNCTVVSDELQWMWNEAAMVHFKIVYRYLSDRFHQLPITVATRFKEPAQTLGSWVRIQIEAWMPVCVYSIFVLFLV